MAVEVGAAQQIQQILPREKRNLHVDAVFFGQMMILVLTGAFAGENEVNLLAVDRAADGFYEDFLILFARQAAG